MTNTGQSRAYHGWVQIAACTCAAADRARLLVTQCRSACLAERDMGGWHERNESTRVHTTYGWHGRLTTPGCVTTPGSVGRCGDSRRSHVHRVRTRDRRQSPRGTRCRSSPLAYSTRASQTQIAEKHEQLQRRVIPDTSCCKPEAYRGSVWRISRDVRGGRRRDAKHTWTG